MPVTYALVITSTCAGGRVTRAIASVLPTLTQADRVYVESGFQDPRSLLDADGPAPFVTVDDLAPADVARPSGTVVVGLDSAAARGWERWQEWADGGWDVIVLHDGGGDHLANIAAHALAGRARFVADDPNALPVIGAVIGDQPGR